MFLGVARRLEISPCSGPAATATRSGHPTSTEHHCAGICFAPAADPTGMKLMLASLHRLVSVCAALPLCMPVVADAHALPVLRSVRIDSSSQDALTLGQPSVERLAYVQGDEADPAMADGAREEDDDNDVTYGVDDYHDDFTYGVDDYQIMDGDEDAVMDDGTSFRKLLHGCHGDSRSVCACDPPYFRCMH